MKENLSNASNVSGTTYDVIFESEGPMGIELVSNKNGSDAFVAKSSHPEIIVGHSLVAVNDEAVEGSSFDDILQKIAQAAWPRILTFTSSKRIDKIAEDDPVLPLPEDFFSDLAELSNQEEEYIKELMQSQLNEALSFVKRKPEDNGLSLSTESDGVSVFLGSKKDIEGEDVQLVLSKVDIPIAADLMMNAAVTSTTSTFKRIFTLLDPMFADGQVLHVIPSDYKQYGGKTVRSENLNLPLYSVKWGAWKLPFPLSARDFVFCEFTCWAEEGYGVSMCMSIPRISSRVKNLENSHGIVRGNMGMTGYFWKNKEGCDPKKPMGNNSMCIELTYMLQINVKGSIPRWAVNMVGPIQGLNVKRVRDYAMQQRDLAAVFLNQNIELNGTETRFETVDSGMRLGIPVEVPAGWELVYDWILQDHDIQFGIEGPDDKMELPVASHTCSLKNNTPYHGRLTASRSGVYKLVFDNSRSWFTNKTVFYHCVAVSPTDELPWPKWPTLEEALADE